MFMFVEQNPGTDIILLIMISPELLSFFATDSRAVKDYLQMNMDYKCLYIFQEDLYCKN